MSEAVTSTGNARLVHLRGGGVSVVVDASGPGLPRLLHWGKALADDGGALAGLLATDPPPEQGTSLDAPRAFTLLPTQYEGWSGTPGIEVHTAGTRAAPRLTLAGVEVDGAEWSVSDGAHPGTARPVPDGEHPATGPTAVAGPGATAVHLPTEADPATAATARFNASDPSSALDVEIHLTLDEHGVLRARASVSHRGESTLDLAALRLLLPLPTRASEHLDLTGRWPREFTPQRGPVLDGTHRRAARRGRPGHDTPLVLAVGTPGFAFRTGEVWAVHVAWSGAGEYLVERLPEGAGPAFSAVVGGGELLDAGEVRLEPGESYATPELTFVWSSAGLDGLSSRWHTALRARPGHPRSPRPLTLNTWEAVVFDHDLDRLRTLADRAAEVGAERFVLDDGWFLGRRSDDAGLGDWTVDETVWPGGLGPIVDHVRALGMQFGLWFEPEMVNLDSELARAHPDWLLGPASGPGLPARHQHVLDLANAAVSEYLFGRISALVAEHSIDYLKWDHNRDLLEAVRASREDAPGVRAQTLAYWGLLDRLRAAHPGLEIESCASGGGRIDLGVLERTDRVWASDTIDPVERQSIQRWLGVLLPPELVGSHVGGPLAHTTGRLTELNLRLVTALFGHAGIEWDLTRCTPDELARLRAWAGLYREVRGLLHTGVTVRADLADPSLLLHGVVAPDRSEALFAWVRTTTGAARWPGRVVLPGLDPARCYTVRIRPEVGEARRHQNPDPAWLTAATGSGTGAVGAGTGAGAVGSGSTAVLSGEVLTEVGVTLPTLAATNALVLHLTATPDAS